MTPAAPAPQPPAAAPERAQVLVQAPVGVLDYAVPEALAAELHVGVAVRVPLGRRELGGYVVGLLGAEPATEATPDSDSASDCAERSDGSPAALRAIVAIDGDQAPLPPSVLALVRFAADYYGVHPGEMLRNALPATARTGSSRYVLTEQGRTSKAAHAEALMALGHKHPRGFAAAALERVAGITRVQAQGVLRRAAARGDLSPAQARVAKVRQEVIYTRLELPDAERAERTETLGRRQARARALLAAMPTGSGLSLPAIRTIDPSPAGPLKALLERGLVARHTRDAPSVPHGAGGEAHPEDLSDAGARHTPPPPTPEQARALETLTAALERRTFFASLLHGVTGSGKTEVYLQAIAHALGQGRSALVLVPEIALTPQLGERFRRRFGARVATFHSGLSVAERRDEWQRVVAGEAVIGLGARSALFLPLHDLGIIIVDEEHETSFKQDESPRYNARDLAVWRAQAAGAVVVLGSATPSLETWHNAERGRYQLLTMAERVHARPLPVVEVLPLQSLERVGEAGALTRPLLDAVESTLKAGNQAILFLNRRGFAPYVFCRDCGHSFRCEDCEVSMTLHRRRGVLVCHYCNATVHAPDVCPGCHGHRVGAFGLGTEQLESEVRTLLGDVPLVRLDRDTIRTRRDLEAALGRFRRQEARLLIGTQMVAKGHDFPGVTLVGVISADSSLNFPDFRAAERTFQLLTQVAGRAGRGELPGRVLVQAYEPEHYAIAAAQRHDYAAFVKHELAHRRELGYPPFAFLALVRLEAESEAAAMGAATEQATAWRTHLEAMGPDLDLLGPAPAPLARLRGMTRVHLLLKAPTRQRLRQALAALPRAPGRHLGEAVRRIVDVDPVTML